jgi:diacylglycerol kinase family enzyme
VEVSGFSCDPLANPAPHFEADGEWLGRLPMRVSLAPDALRVRLPARHYSQR